MRSSVRLAAPSAFLAAAMFCACPDHAPAGPADASVAPAIDAGPAVPAIPDLKISVQEVLADGGTAVIPFELGVKPKIEPTQELQLRANLGLKNVRVRVFDESDKAMVSDDAQARPTPEVPFDYRIHFAAPLKTGHRYSLVLDAQTGALFADSTGRDQADQRLELQVLGEREKPAPVKHAKAKHRRR